MEKIAACAIKLEELGQVRALGRHGIVTLVYSALEEDNNDAVFRELLLQ